MTAVSFGVILFLENASKKFIIDKEELLLEELSPTPIIQYLSEQGVEAAIASHPHNRRYQVSCILAAVIRLGGKACEQLTQSFTSTGHGYVDQEWQKWRKGKKYKGIYRRSDSVL